MIGGDMQLKIMHCCKEKLLMVPHKQGCPHVLFLSEVPAFCLDPSSLDLRPSGTWLSGKKNTGKTQVDPLQCSFLRTIGNINVDVSYHVFLF